MKKKKVNDKRGAERDEAIQRQNDMRLAGRIYEQWRTKFVSTRKDPADIADQVNELSAQLFKAIKTEEVRKYITDVLLPPLMVRAHVAAAQILNSVEVLVDCPNEIRINGVASPCGWGGIARPSKKEYALGTVQMTCPQCGSILGKDDMALKSDIDQQIEQSKKNRLN
jgi:hypothetical protein